MYKNLIITFFVFLCSINAFADEPTTAATFHIAVSEAEAGEPVWIRASFPKDWKLETAQLFVRPRSSSTSFDAIRFLRDEDGSYVAEIPEELSQPPGLEYYISTTRRGEKSVDRFASSQNPQPIIIVGDTAETKREARLERHRGQTSEFELRGSATTFGERRVAVDNGTVDTDPISDRYWTTELNYTFRPLGVLYDFGFGIGFLRGQRAQADAQPLFELESGEPGLNYGFGHATLELGKNFSTQGTIILGASARGFAGGAGALIRVGRIGGTRLEFEGEVISDVGFVASMLFGWDTVPNFPMSLKFSATDRPDPSTSPVGVELAYAVEWFASDQFRIGGHIGYSSRSDGLSIGYTAGLNSKFGF